ncbi:MAG: High-affinity zinc uptake system binding-protein ZnuA [Verrucomicrobia subdivision 3 bacterium]|nr:High-affinity zinc uptake system binding-protein ZnuA [Limisphaerales bacterium]MCS1417059.1 High-affinity zinc uptake system binding-protein ZnuA [Limisphaerales bacterium]
MGRDSGEPSVRPPEITPGSSESRPTKSRRSIGLRERMEGMLRIITGWAIAVIMAIGAAGCSPQGQAPTERSEAPRKGTEGPPIIYVVNYPLWYLTSRIVGEHAKVVLPPESGSDPAFWRPTETHVQAYQNADLILLWGADYAKWVQNVTLPYSRVIDTGKPIRDRYIFEQEMVTHSHGDSGEHSHGAVVFTSWLDFELLLQQAREIADRLMERYPQHARPYGENFRGLEADLLAIDQQFNDAIPESLKEPVFASHPVYQYLARRYGLKLTNFHWEPGEAVEESEWAKFDELMEEQPARWMLWEGSPEASVASRLREAGVTPIVILTVGGIPESGDFLTIMQENAARLRTAFHQ